MQLQNLAPLMLVKTHIEHHRAIDLDHDKIARRDPRLTAGTREDLFDNGHAHGRNPPACTASLTTLLATRNQHHSPRTNDGQKLEPDDFEKPERQMASATLSAPPCGAGRKSGPGQSKRLASLKITQDRASSKPRRRFTSIGISTARWSSAGGEWVIGRTVTGRAPSRSSAVRTMAQGRSFRPSSRPSSCSSLQRYE